MLVKLLKSPRFLVLLWGAAGAVATLYVILAAGAKPEASKAPSVEVGAASLRVGAMEKFELSIAPQPAPDVPYVDAAGKPAFLKTKKGKVVLVNFWATWCAPCREELPALDALQRDRGGADFEVVAIAADPRGRAAVEAFLKKTGATALAPNMDADLRLATALGAGAGLPLTILYGRDGREIGRLRGAADWSSPEAGRLVAAATGE